MAVSRLRRAAVTLAVVLALTAVKGYVYLGTGSLAALSEFLDSVLDIVASVGTLYAVREGMRGPDAEHPYGHGKFESLMAYTVAVFAGLAGFYVVAELAQRLLHGYEVAAEPWYLLLVLLTVAVDAGLAGYNYIGYRREGSMALRANFVNYLGDTFRGSGVLLALAAASAGMHLVDVAVAAVLVAILFREAYSLIRESSRVLLDEAPREMLEAARRAAEGVEGVVAVKRVRARCMGDRAFVDVTVLVPPGMSVEEAHRVADEVEERIRESLRGADVVAHVEPARGDA